MINEKLNPENVDDIKDSMKLELLNQAHFFRNGNDAEKVKAIEYKITIMLMYNPEYSKEFKIIY